MRLPPLNFRAKILLALLGMALLLVGSSLLAIRSETERQIALIADETAARAVRAFVEIDGLRREEMARLGERFTLSVRLPAALDEAIVWGDPGVLEEAAQYELELAGLTEGMAAFTDWEGREIALLIDGTPISRPDGGEPDPWVASFLEGTEPTAHGYRLREGELFSVQLHPLFLFGEPIGSLLLGFRIDEESARRLGEAVGTGLCFAAGGGCLVGGEEIAGGEGLSEAITDALAAREPVFIEADGARRALLAAPLPGDGGEEIFLLLSVPLDEALAPFDRLLRVVQGAGVVALLLAALLGIVISRGLVRPVHRLVAATERVRKGDYDFSVEVGSRDELGTLAGAFNEMVGDLALKEKYRGVLDKVVSRDVAEELLRGEIRLGGETRVVTTLFSDVRGFTSLSEGMDSQRVITLLNEWFDLAAGAVESEGGVVDKFMGDGLMAIFGAPNRLPDHAERAVRAGLRMREALARMNEEARAEGRSELRVGIGIATGEAVAGNTGSKNRMNYTVLGETVNLASRLCSEAGANEILVSEATHQALGGGFEADAAAPRKVKGLSYEVRPWLIRGMGGASVLIPVTSRSLASLIQLLAGLPLVLFLATLLASVSPIAVHAQGIIPDPPTLAEAGFEYISPSGRFQLTPSGRIDMEAYFPGDSPPWLIPETDPFLAGRLRLFLDAFVGDRIQGTIEVRADRGAAPSAGDLDLRLQQAFLRIALPGNGRWFLQGGKFVSPFGNHPSRHRTAAEPFIRPPVFYDHRTALDTRRVPGGVAGFLGWKDEGDGSRALGAPVIWETPYPAGAMLLGGVGPVSLRLAMVNSAPSSDPDAWGFGAEGPWTPSWIGHFGIRLIPELHLGASYNRGPYLRPEAEALLRERAPSRPEIEDYLQELWSVEANFARGPFEARGEVVLDRWEVPNVSDEVRDTSWFLEGKVKSGSGAFAAVRLSEIRHGEVAGPSGDEPWDHDVRRWQGAVGYRLARNLEVRGEVLRQSAPTAPTPATHLVSGQLSWRF